MENKYDDELKRELRMWCIERVNDMKINHDPVNALTVKATIANAEEMYNYITAGMS